MILDLEVGTENVSTAQQIATETLEGLSALGIPPSPTNYTVWYFYVSKEHTALRKDIEQQLASKANFGERDISALFETYFGVANHNREIELISEQLVNEMKSILDSLDGANQTSGSYGNALASLSGALVGGGETPDLEPVINAVAQATKKMAVENLALGSQLTSSSSEITQLKADLEDMRLQAMTDGLTGIANRKCFDIEIENAIQFAKDDNRPLSLLMLDVDHFKKFNDVHGHQIGDHVLKLLAGIFKDAVKGQDTPARYGGEEFSIILPETPLAGAVGLAEKIRNRIVRRPLLNKNTGGSLGNITISVGAAELNSDETSEELIARADKALYGAKAAGRDQVVAA